MKTHYDTPDSALAQRIATASVTDAPPEYATLVEGGSSVSVRLFGGALLSARLVGPDSAAPQEVLYPGGRLMPGQLSNPRLRASHFGAPAGPDGFQIGHNHGAFRHTMHTLVQRSCGRIVLTASLPTASVSAERDIDLRSDRLDVTNVLANNRPKGGDGEATSLLEHLYLNLGNETPSSERPLLINGQTLDDLLGEQGAGEQILNGEPYLWSGFGDEPGATVTMPDGSQIGVSATVNGEQVNTALLWAPLDEPAFCIEPVDGLSEGGNRGRIIPAGREAILAVTVTAIQGALAA